MLENIYDTFMAPLERSMLQQRRRRLIPGLKGNIVEVGCGTGINFSLYDAGSKVLACEPARNMYQKAVARAEDPASKARITIVPTGLEDLEFDKRIASYSIDAIVCTLVMCSIPDPEDAMIRFRRWLKPGGKLILLEHVAPDHPLFSRFVNLVNPLWRHFSDGCNLNRHTHEMWKKNGFRPVYEESFRFIIPFYQSEWVRE